MTSPLDHCFAIDLDDNQVAPLHSKESNAAKTNHELTQYQLMLRPMDEYVEISTCDVPLRVVVAPLEGQ